MPFKVAQAYLVKMEHNKLNRLIDSKIREFYERKSIIYPRDYSKLQSSDIHEIFIPNFSSQVFEVACDAKTRGGG